MAKTTFGPGVIVTSKFLNGLQQLHFDGLDEDFHYPQINLSDIQRGGDTGLDSIYVTLGTDQTYASTPITGNKSFQGLAAFGDQTSSIPSNAPKSWVTNDKFNQGGVSQEFLVKYANLADEDMLTKAVLEQRVDNFPNIDEGSF